MMKSPVVWVRIVILASGLYMLSQVTVIYLPIIVAVVAAFVLNPLVNALTAISLGARKYHLPRGVAILLVFVLTALLLTVLTTFVLLPFVSEFNNFVINLPKLTNRIRNLAMLIEHQANLAQVPDNIRQLIENGLGGAASYGIGLVRNGINAIFTFATQIIELVVVPVMVYYFLKDWRSLKDGVVTLFPLTAQACAISVIEEMAVVVSNYIRGQVLISVIMGLLVFSGMYFMGVDYPIVLGLLATLTETIPIIGPIIGAIPAILMAYLASPLLAIKVAAFYIILHQIENHIIVPNIMGHTIDLHPILVIISLLIGGQLYGIAGMILAVPVAALLKVILRHLWYLDKVNKDR
ncbi:AI-2E family transporter [Sporomusa sp.]|uniref:AI-2E family transporter n=1 Tax=Sporomusa sp. TaxID=2078658 RepID=UPI002D1D5455|nr:AI-2E family transporter [Sporomusa sp.]HWR45352.1 AI-2E family transporter [Sporomusa sp.]